MALSLLHGGCIFQIAILSQKCFFDMRLESLIVLLVEISHEEGDQCMRQLLLLVAAFGIKIIEALLQVGCACAAACEGSVRFCYGLHLATFG